MKQYTVTQDDLHSLANAMMDRNLSFSEKLAALEACMKKPRGEGPTRTFTRSEFEEAVEKKPGYPSPSAYGGRFTDQDKRDYHKRIDEWLDDVWGSK